MTLNLQSMKLTGILKVQSWIFFEYRKNTMLKRAVERNFEIIGEALNRILKSNPDFEHEIPMPNQSLFCEIK